MIIIHKNVCTFLYQRAKCESENNIGNRTIIQELAAASLWFGNGIREKEKHIVFAHHIAKI